MEKFKSKIKECLQDDPTFCTAICPFHLDIREFIPKMQRGGFNAAYRTYLNAVGFPRIVSELCEEPCKIVCPRCLKDAAVDIKGLEKAAINYTRNPNPNSYNVPPKNKKIAIIGAGISGLACALRLASKKYEVTVFEKSGRIGGHLWDVLAPEVFLDDLERQFMYEKYTLCLNQEITSLAKLDFDAIYIATGKGGEDFGLQMDTIGAFASNEPGVFLGGELCGSNIVEAIADGLQVVNAIERYIKAGSMNQPSQNNETKIELNGNLITYMEPVVPSSGGIFTQEEAISEAKRCLKCACDACIRHCDLMSYYGKFPKRIGEEVEVTVNPGTLDGNGTVATRLISTCNQCGLCKEVCHLKIDTGDFLLKSHIAMHENGTMPWVFHDFWLRDMEFTNSEKASLCKKPKGYEKSHYMFFPGCQLGASDPRYVKESYGFLLSKHHDTSLMLSCCAAPAKWAGDELLHKEAIAQLLSNWISLGKPTAIFACPTCKQMFNKYLPEIQGVFLYDFILETEILPTKDVGERVSVFDPCSSREEPELQQKIRALTKRAGFSLEPLKYEGKLARCCSWGGQISTANPSFAREVVKTRITENDNTYVAYCVNCRDIFAASGKPCFHILDVLFNLNDSTRLPPSHTKRRSNRIELRNELLLKYWNEAEGIENMESKIKLNISPRLKQKLSEELILETDIQTVVEHCESSGRKTVDVNTGAYAGHLVIGNMTYWVVYLKKEDGYELVDAYSHRMMIEEA